MEKKGGRWIGSVEPWRLGGKNMKPPRIPDEIELVNEWLWESLLTRIPFNRPRLEILATPNPSGFDWIKYIQGEVEGVLRRKKI
jgi:hypothetical protein